MILAQQEHLFSNAPPGLDGLRTAGRGSGGPADPRRQGSETHAPDTASHPVQHPRGDQAPQPGASRPCDGGPPGPCPSESPHPRESPLLGSTGSSVGPAGPPETVRAGRLGTRALSLAPLGAFPGSSRQPYTRAAASNAAVAPTYRHRFRNMRRSKRVAAAAAAAANTATPYSLNRCQKNMAKRAIASPAAPAAGLALGAPLCAGAIPSRGGDSACKIFARRLDLAGADEHEPSNSANTRQAKFTWQAYTPMVVSSADSWHLGAVLVGEKTKEFWLAHTLTGLCPRTTHKPTPRTREHQRRMPRQRSLDWLCMASIEQFNQPPYLDLLEGQSGLEVAAQAAVPVAIHLSYPMSRASRHHARSPPQAKAGDNTSRPAPK